MYIGIRYGTNFCPHIDDRLRTLAGCSITRKLGTFDLSGCEIYASCEPCPMCLAAIYWAHLDKIYYANTRKDAAEIGFDDDFIYNEIPLEPSQRQKQIEELLPEEAKRAFEMWKTSENKVEY